ncbi:hypothetical protein AB0C59_24645 [Streptomyces sp. NPDC048664]|uniref:hypothetical protein n=1 Tax=Streptomyces sp. NPDC048664 TaxID=3154505 RepID=UPI00342C5D5F
METVEFPLTPLPPGSGEALAERLAALLAARADAVVVVCEVSALVEPTAADLDHLARLRLAARRAGREFVLRDAGPALRSLLTLTGLAEVLEDGRRPGRPRG